VQFGLGWQPQVVVFGLCVGNDFAQCFMARDSTSGTRDARHIELPAAALAPGWQPFDPGKRWIKPLRRSRLLGLLWPVERGCVPAEGYQGLPKAFDWCHGLGCFLAEPPAEVRRAYEHTKGALAELDAACRAAGVRFAVLVFPQRFQVQPRDWDLTVRDFGLVASAFDLERPNRVLAAWGATAGVEVIDPTAAMAAHHARTGEAMYLPQGDMHWNAAGHRVCAAAVAGRLEPILRAARVAAR
jgi:hypothetical protein